MPANLLVCVDLRCAERANELKALGFSPNHDFDCGGLLSGYEHFVYMHTKEVIPCILVCGKLLLCGMKVLLESGIGFMIQFFSCTINSLGAHEKCLATEHHRLHLIALCMSFDTLPLFCCPACSGTAVSEQSSFFCSSSILRLLNLVCYCVSIQLLCVKTHAIIASQNLCKPHLAPAHTSYANVRRRVLLA